MSARRPQASAPNIGTTSTGGTLTTGTGLFTINTTGTVTIGSGANTGTLNANGNLTIDGGNLVLGSTGTLSLASGKTMTIQNSAAATFNQGYTTAANAIYNVTGSGSEWELIGGSSTLGINNNSEVNVSGGGSLSVGGDLSVGNGSNGTLRVEGSGSSVTIGGASTLAVGHATIGTALISIGNGVEGGTLTTGTGLFTINATGSVFIGSGTNTGTLNANGDVTIDGGTLTRAITGAFNLATGRKLTASNDAQVTLAGIYFLDDGTEVEINTGADLTTTPLIGFFSDGTLVVDVPVRRLGPQSAP